MVQVGTVGELLVLAAQAERQAETLYDAIGKMFMQQPEVARFWTHYADEEAGHARWMNNLRARLSAEQLARPVDPQVFSRAIRLLDTNLEELISGINDLQDAWDLANEMEHGETNIIFEFLINNFSGDPQTLAFLRAQLRGHMDHLLVGLPAQLSSIEMRRATFPIK
jgi:hypothetical protein